MYYTSIIQLCHDIKLKRLTLNRVSLLTLKWRIILNTSNPVCILYYSSTNNVISLTHLSAQTQNNDENRKKKRSKQVLNFFPTQAKPIMNQVQTHMVPGLK